MILFTAGYFFALIYLLFFAFFRVGTTTEVNWIPFGTMWPLTKYTFQSGKDWWHWIVNVPGNILFFVPAGIILQAFFKSTYIKIFGIGVVFSTLLETLQFLFQTGSCDVDDILLNATGILLGYFLFTKIKKQPAV